MSTSVVYTCLTSTTYAAQCLGLVDYNLAVELAGCRVDSHLLPVLVDGIQVDAIMFPMC